MVEDAAKCKLSNVFERKCRTHSCTCIITLYKVEMGDSCVVESLFIIIIIITLTA